jgi:hypothetical protein
MGQRNNFFLESVRKETGLRPFSTPGYQDRQNTEVIQTSLLSILSEGEMTDSVALDKRVFLSFIHCPFLLYFLQELSNMNLV